MIVTMVRNLCLCVLLAVLGCNLSEASSCNCTDAICPTMGTFCPNGRILGDCGCCSVCVRRANEVCGGKHSILGKCESDLRCAYERFKLESKLKIGFCEYPTGKHQYVVYLFMCYLGWSKAEKSY